MVETVSTNPEPVPARPASRLGRRLACCVVVPMAAGFFLGKLDPASVANTFAVVVGLAFTVVFGIGLAWQQIGRPIRDLSEQLHRLTLIDRQVQVRELPTDRDDEVGDIARSVRELYRNCIRDHHEARRLRRTLDDRVRQATDRAVKNLNKLAMRDPLTDLGNRRFLDENLPGFIKAARESDTDLICVMFDMDNFKQVNDTLGHATGDELLILLADLIKTSVRSEDLAVRLGGDEFVVFLVDGSLDLADQITHHIRQIYRQRAATLLKQTVVTDLSVGSASLKLEKCQTAEELIAQADTHLYQAKRNGKGMTCSIHGCTAA